MRSKIGAEAARLRGHTNNDGEGVDIVQREIEAALERENLDRERGMAGEANAGAESGSHGDIKNSTALLGDLEEVRQKVEKYRERASLTDHLGVKKAREAVTSCYQLRPVSSLFSLFFPLNIHFRPPPMHAYRANPTTTLNCWSEVAAFRSSVAELEQVCGHLRCLAVNTESDPSRNMLTRYGSNNKSINLSLQYHRDFTTSHDLREVKLLKQVTIEIINATLSRQLKIHICKLSWFAGFAASYQA